MIQALSDSNFEKEVVEKGGVCVVDFWATWCIPCKKVKTVLEALAPEFPNVRFYELNVEHNVETSSRFEIQALPTVLIFKDGNVVERIVGSPPGGLKKIFTDKISKYLD